MADCRDRPAPRLAQKLADWLSGPRSRALRRAGIGRRQRVLEVGAGHGVVTEELMRRCRGVVVALDIDPTTLAGEYAVRALRVAADAQALPFDDASFDLVFFQNVLLWMSDVADTIAEAARVLAPAGVLVALEPDYGAMIEYPVMGLREVWNEALERAGADPLTGRKLPGLCESAGLHVWVELTHIPRQAEVEALDLLADLPLVEREQAMVEDARAQVRCAPGQWGVFLHVPYFLVVAERR